MAGDNAARPPDPPEEIIAAALSARHIQLWNTSAYFHMAVEQLATLLVPMIDGLADAAEREDERMRRAARDMAMISSSVVPLSVTSLFGVAPPVGEPPPE